MSSNKKLFSSIIILTIFIILALSTQAFIYDDFEDNLNNWTTAGDPLISSTQAYNGTNSAQLDGDSGAIDTLSGTINGFPQSGAQVLSIWFFWSKATISDDVELDLTDGGIRIFKFSAGYPVNAEWGRENGGWASYGVSSNSGSTNVVQQWVNIKILFDQDNANYSIMINDTILVSNEAYAGGTAFDQIDSISPTTSTGDFLYVDMVEYWDWDVYGWDRPPEATPPPTSLTSLATEENYNITSPENNSVTFNLKILWNETNVTASQSTFYYDEQSYTPTLDSSSYSLNGSANYSVTVTTPIIDLNNTKKEFYWTYELIDNETEVYYEFNGDAIDNSSNSYDGIVDGATLTSDRYGNSNSAYFFDGINDYINTTANKDYSGQGDFTFSLWVKNNVLTNAYGIAQAHTTNPYTSDLFIVASTNIFWLRSETIGLYSNIDDNSWYYLTMVWDKSSETYEGFVDGVSIGTSGVVAGYGGVSDVIIGARGDLTTSFYNGTIDDFRIYTTSLTQTQITNLKDYNMRYNTHRINQTITWNYPRINITVADNYGNNLNNFTTSAYTFTNTTTSGSVLFILPNLNNYSVFVNNTDYFTKTENTNVNDLYTTKQIIVTQSEITINAFDKVTSTQLNNFTVNDTTISNTTTSGSLKINLLEGVLQTLTFTNEQGYYNNTFIVNISKLDNLTLNVTNVYDHQLTFYANDSFRNLTVSGFTINLYNNEYEYNETYTATGTSVTFNVSTLANYTSIISHENFTTTTTNHTGLSGSISNYTYFLDPFNSIIINLFNETGFNPILQAVNVKTISDIIAIDNTTTNSFFVLPLLFPNEYELRFTSDGFNSRSAFITVLNDSTTNLTIYLTSNATSEQQVIQILDTSNQEVEGAIIWLQKEKHEEENEFITVQEAKTDFNGETIIFVEKNPTIFYRFIVIYEGEARPIQPSGNTYTGKTSFIEGFTETIQIVINIEGTNTNLISDLQGISTNLTIGGENNNTVNYTFLDARNTITGGKLQILGRYLNSSFGYELIHEENITGTSGLLTYTLPIVNNTAYKIRGFILKTSGETLTDEITKTFDANVIIEKNTGLLYALLIIIVVAFITVSYGVLWSSILTIASLFLTNLFGLTDLPTTIITSFIALAIILFLKGGRGNNGQ